jgi:hypothetical protein
VISSTIDPLEHVKHDFVIVVVQKPNAGILIIFLEWNCTHPDANEKTARKKSMEPSPLGENPKTRKMDLN